MQTYIEKTALSDEMQTLKDKASALCKKYHVLAENDSWQKAVQAYRTVCDVVEAIEALPTVDIDAITGTHEKIGFDKGYSEGYAQATVDAEPVVRCKDCQYFNKYGFKLEYTECTHFDCDVTEEGYCAWGERRENETD